MSGLHKAVTGVAAIMLLAGAVLVKRAEKKMKNNSTAT